MVADLNADGAAATVEEIEQVGGTAVAVTGDLSEQAVVDQVTATAVERFGGVDVLVNNAGIMDSMSALADVSDAEWERVIRVNLTAPFLLARAVLPHMLAAGGGAVVNTASEASLRGSAAAGRRLHGVQARCGGTDQVAGGDVPQGRYPRQRRVPGRHRDRHRGGGRPDGAQARRGARSALRQPRPRPGPRSRRQRSCSWPRRPRATSTARSCPSTTAGPRSDAAPVPTREPAAGTYPRVLGVRISSMDSSRHRSRSSWKATAPVGVGGGAVRPAASLAVVVAGGAFGVEPGVVGGVFGQGGDPGVLGFAGRFDDGAPRLGGRDEGCAVDGVLVQYVGVVDAAGALCPAQLDQVGEAVAGGNPCRVRGPRSARASRSRMPPRPRTGESARADARDADGEAGGEDEAVEGVLGVTDHDAALGHPLDAVGVRGVDEGDGWPG